MTVAELIERLKAYSPDAEVRFADIEFDPLGPLARNPPVEVIINTPDGIILDQR